MTQELNINLGESKMTVELWNTCPSNWKTNFEVILCDEGFWQFNHEFGKTILNIKPKGQRLAPTNADQRNFITGLLEAEWRNDNFVFKDGTSRPPQKKLQLDRFKRFLNEIEIRFNANVEKGMDYYINLGGFE